jgi:hypothetical protein
MPHQGTVRLLGGTNNEKGDLFTRLAKDLFFSLGYADLKLDVAVAGREIDIQGCHRFEPRYVVAECKAHREKIGGDELNKFLGVLTRERHVHKPRPVAGYFVSLSGFTGGAVEQERNHGDERLMLVDGAKLINELQAGRVVVPLVQAAATAGECVTAAGLRDLELARAELLVDHDGYVWALTFSHGKQPTHFALVHAGGAPLAPAVAGRIVSEDEAAGGALHELEYLPPRPPPPSAAAQTAEALRLYHLWLATECGYIQLDGLPADTDLSATKLRLERLYVPLKATPSVPRSVEDWVLSFGRKLQKAGRELEPDGLTSHAIRGSEKRLDVRGPTESIGALIATTQHLAILASPGGGKSTLLKRLAMAYSSPERRAEVTDDLPDRDWLPLYLRCRDLRDRAHRPIVELIQQIGASANMDPAQAASFWGTVGEVLRAGKTLLLVDGLDEITEEGSRRAFAHNLRTFIGMFPQAAVVVTSRIAGFREIAGVIASACTQVTLAPLDASDVRSLCVSWHAEVVGDNDKVRGDASLLAQTIWANERIRGLVQNPLLLTTLLVVKRWIGELPPNRVKLYREATRVLIRTWNVEGYGSSPDEDETLARLSYVACAMMTMGTQKIGRKHLMQLLQEAAKEMSAELQYAAVSPAEFIRRVEYRSSLLMQTGQGTIDGELQPVFEFRHLTFQEYLAARGFVEEQYPGRGGERPLVEILEPHFADEFWRELIPLAAALAARKADVLIRKLTALAKSAEKTDQIGARKGGRRAPGRASKNRREEPSFDALRWDFSTSQSWSLKGKLLVQCMLDEVVVQPDTSRAALEVLVSERHASPDQLCGLAKGKFSGTFREVAEKAYVAGGGESWELDAILCYLSDSDPEAVRRLAGLTSSGELVDRIRAAFGMRCAAFRASSHADEGARQRFAEAAQGYHDQLAQMLRLDDPAAVATACCALASLGNIMPEGHAPALETLESLVRLWENHSRDSLAFEAARAFAQQPLRPRDEAARKLGGDCNAWLAKELQTLIRMDGLLGPAEKIPMNQESCEPNELAGLAGAPLVEGAMIVGVAGQGKTSLLKYLAYATPERSSERLKAELATKWPGLDLAFEWPSLDHRTSWTDNETPSRMKAALILAWYRGAPATDEELARYARFSLKLMGGKDRQIGAIAGQP